MRARVLLSLLVLLPLGCGLFTESELGVDFRPERPEYRQSETARMVLTNGTDRPIGYHLCISAWERREGGVWTRSEPLRICAAALGRLEPGAQVVLEEPITAEWQPGIYRMVTGVVLREGDTRTEVFTPPFTVQP